MIILRLFGSVICAWLISVIGVIFMGEIVENKNVLEEFLVVLLCIWVYMGYRGIIGHFNKRLRKT
jgi:hypothetical protein